MYTRTGVGRDLPHYIWGSVTIYNFYQAISGTDCSTQQCFAVVPPRLSSPPEAHIYGGVVSLSSAYRYLSTKIKE